MLAQADYDIYIYIHVIDLLYKYYIYINYIYICMYVLTEKTHENTNLLPLHVTLHLVAMEVCFLVSGETLTVLGDEVQGQTAKAAKKALAAKVGMSRFKQRFFVGDGSHQIQDDEVLDPAPLKIQLVVLEFWQPDDEKT